MIRFDSSFQCYFSIARGGGRTCDTSLQARSLTHSLVRSYNNSSASTLADLVSPRPSQLQLAFAKPIVPFSRSNRISWFTIAFEPNTPPLGSSQYRRLINSKGAVSVPAGQSLV
mmetsp:Transcript_22522/g.34337  ORF Transcript_22522/g.34337 Transcript_22522/m.34337 type:complete len:114 (+) Transcript_22522:379-720(+)